MADQPFPSIRLETDSLPAVAKEFEVAGGIPLQNLEDRHLWLVQGYLITVVELKSRDTPPRVSPQLRPADNRFRRMLTNIGLVLIIIAFSVVFIGTLILMATRP